MTPFPNETEAEQIGGLTVENRLTRLAPGLMLCAT